MSEQKHTPEPWHVTAPGTFSPARIYGADRKLVAECDDGVGQPREDNARRITACVNACAGLPDMVLDRRRPLVYREQVSQTFFQAFHQEWNARDGEYISQDFGQAVHDRMMKALFPPTPPLPQRR